MSTDTIIFPLNVLWDYLCSINYYLAASFSSCVVLLSLAKVAWALFSLKVSFIGDLLSSFHIGKFYAMRYPTTLSEIRIKNNHALIIPRFQHRRSSLRSKRSELRSPLIQFSSFHYREILCNALFYKLDRRFIKNIYPALAIPRFQH